MLHGWLLVRKKLRNGPVRWLACPPVEYRWDLIRLVHDMLCHPGMAQTLLQVHLHFHWGGIKADIARFIKQCDSCQRHQLILPDLPELQEPALYGPFAHVHVDLAGPFMYTTAGTPVKYHIPPSSNAPGASPELMSFGGIGIYPILLHQKGDRSV